MALAQGVRPVATMRRGSRPWRWPCPCSGMIVRVAVVVRVKLAGRGAVEHPRPEHDDQAVADKISTAVPRLRISICFARSTNARMPTSTIADTPWNHRDRATAHQDAAGPARVTRHEVRRHHGLAVPWPDGVQHAVEKGETQDQCQRAARAAVLGIVKRVGDGVVEGVLLLRQPRDEAGAQRGFIRGRHGRAFVEGIRGGRHGGKDQ